MTYLSADKEDRYRQALVEAKEQIEAQNVVLNKLKEEPLLYGHVLKLLPEQQSVVITTGEGAYIRVPAPKGMKLLVGSTVMITTRTMGIIELVEEPVGLGRVCLVRRVIDKTRCEIERDGNVFVAVMSKKALPVDVGDRVVVDASASVVLANQGKDESRFTVTETPNTLWSDIGGLEEAKRVMIEAVEMPYKHANVYKHYGKKPVKGVLLYGPPGCGKTMLGKATATAMARIHDHKATDTGFIYVKGPEILDKFVGNSEATIRSLFSRAREHKKKHGYPAVIFIDEAEAVLSKRGSGRSADMERTIVPMFLAEMDGMDESSAVVLLATNRSDMLDSAIVRDGRIDRKVKVTRPLQIDAEAIFQLHLKDVPVTGMTVMEAAKAVTAELYSDQRCLYAVKVGDGEKRFLLGGLSSGAMIHGVVDRASSFAMERDIKNNKFEGVTKEDLIKAVDAVHRETSDLNHNDDLAEFIHDFKDDVIDIHKVRLAA